MPQDSNSTEPTQEKNEEVSKRELSRMGRKDLASEGFKKKVILLPLSTAIALEMEVARSQSDDSKVITRLIDRELI